LQIEYLIPEAPHCSLLSHCSCSDFRNRSNS